MTITLYSAAGSGGVAVEAALRLIGLPHTIVEAETWSSAARNGRLGPIA